MSRRHTSSRGPSRRSRAVAGVLLALLIVSVAPGGAALAQDDPIRDQDVQGWEWQLLRYRVEAEGEPVPVPPGVGATLQLFSGSAFGRAACSTFETTYTRQQDLISFDLDDPEIERFECDAAGQAFDDAFYDALGQAASLEVTPSILTLNDVITEPLMTFTRARIDDDPTVARWDLARLGDADGSIEQVLPGLDPWIEFLRGGRVVGDTGCGSFYGSYTVNDGTMRISDVASRLGSCADAARRQAERIIASLGDVTDFDVLPAGMRLEDANGATRIALVPDVDLGERTWTPVEVIPVDGQPLLDGKERDLLTEDTLSTSALKLFGGRAEGRGICNFFSGRSITSGLAVSITGLGFGDRTCNKKLTRIEGAFGDALAATASLALRGSELELRDVDGGTLMLLQPQADLVGPTWVLDGIQKRGRKPSGQPPTASFDDFTETVSGSTGAGPNLYLGAYRTPAASEIDVFGMRVDPGRACNNERKAAKKRCRQEAQFLALMERANGYIVRENPDELRLLEDNKALLWFVPEAVERTN